MAGHDIIVIGASTGGVEVLSRLVSCLTPSVPAALFVVLHVRPDAPSLLPVILNRLGRLPARHAVDGEPIRQGRIYIAPPGSQVYLHRYRLSVQRGPRESLHRPAIDPLFRTAAHHHGSRVIGIVLSGALDDGTAGLQAIKDAGGIAIVQEPSDAICASMPASALERVAVDHCVAAADIPDLLDRLVREPADDMPSSAAPLETPDEGEGVHQRLFSGDIIGGLSGMTCPECRGMVREVHDGDVLMFRCRAGHAYTSDTMLATQAESVERKLRTAVQSLEKRAMLVRGLADSARARGDRGVAALFDERLISIERDVRNLRDALIRGKTPAPVVTEAS